MFNTKRLIFLNTSSGKFENPEHRMESGPKKIWETKEGQKRILDKAIKTMESLKRRGLDKISGEEVDLYEKLTKKVNEFHGQFDSQALEEKSELVKEKGALDLFAILDLKEEKAPNFVEIPETTIAADKKEKVQVKQDPRLAALEKAEKETKRVFDQKTQLPSIEKPKS